jgi:hypothetical protein
MRSVDSTSWLLVFAPGSLKEGRTYNLGLVPNSLQDQRGNGVVMSGREYTFSTLSVRCSGHGDYASDAGVCRCYPGYAGLDCEKCAVGYVPQGAGGQCVLNDTSTNNCRPDSCGCLRRSAKGECLEPLGECSPLAGAANGSIQCACDPAYHVTGPRCGDCVPGYYGYPKCQRRDRCNPTCSKNAASCDLARNKCICPKNWAGPTCSECAAGYGGSDCALLTGDASGWDTFFKTFGIIVGILIGVSAFGWLAWWRYKIWRSVPAPRPSPNIPSHFLA